MDTAHIAGQAMAMQASQTQAALSAATMKIAQQADQALVALLTDSVQAAKTQAAVANQVKGGIVA